MLLDVCMMIGEIFLTTILIMKVIEDHIFKNFHLKKMKQTEKTRYSSKKCVEKGLYIYSIWEIIISS